MKASELAKIKEYQKDFQNLFNRKLEIDWYLMNGIEKKRKGNHVPVEKCLEEIFEECVTRHKADVQVIRNKKCRIHRSTCHAEREALVEFSKIVIKEGYSVTKAAKIINRDRGCVYNFGLSDNS